MSAPLNIQTRITLSLSLQRYLRAVERFEAASKEFTEACSTIRESLPNCCNTLTRLRIFGSNGAILTGESFSQSGYSQTFDARQVCNDLPEDPP